MANLADVIDPVIHFLLSFGQQVKNARRGLHHKQVLPVEVSLYPKLPARGFDLTLFQVDGANGFLGVLTLVILQHVRIAAHATSPEHEPAFPPCLQERDKHSIRKVPLTYCSQDNTIPTLLFRLLSHEQSWE